MPQETERRPKRLEEFTDVYGFLEQVRLRPGMWVRHNSLQHLDSMLTGYRIALGVHGIAEPFDFWTPGSPSPFSEWLSRRLGMDYISALGWATEIERAAEQADRPAMEMFFELLDEFRGPDHKARGQAGPENPHGVSGPDPRTS